MNANRKTAIIVGALFITATVSWSIGDAPIASILSDPDASNSHARNGFFSMADSQRIQSICNQFRVCQNRYKLS